MKIGINMHHQAAGYSLPEDCLMQLHNMANNDLVQYDFGDTYYEVNFQRQALNDDLSGLIIDLSKYKDVWGQENSEALIYVTDLHINSEDIQIMGKNSDTIKIVKNGVSYMKFFAKDMISELKKHNEIKMEIVGKANLNCWMGKYTPQIFIENYEIKEDNLLDF